MKKLPFRRPVVAAHWDDSHVDYVVADGKGSQVRILAAGTVTWDEEDVPHSPGDVLAGELARLGQRRVDLVAALGRGRVDVIPLQLPPAGDDELPTLVANQVTRDAGEMAESGAVDFVALPAEANEPRTGFAFAIDATTLEQVRGEAERAGLQLAAIVYRPLASVTLLKRMVPQSSRTMILITLHDREADISIVRRGGLVYTRTARLSEVRNVGDVAAQLSMEVRRSLAAAALAPDAEEQHLYVFGALAETEQLVQELAEELSLPASLLDPLRTENVMGPLPERVGRLSPLIGMVYDHFGKSHATDFLHPKEPPPPPNYVRRIGAYAVMALVLLGAGSYMIWDQHAQARGEIDEMKGTYKQLSDQLNKVKRKQAVVDAVWQWESDNINWLDEFYDLAKRFPPPRDAMVRRFSVSQAGGQRSSIDLSVHVRESDVVTQMGLQLRDEFHDVNSRGVSERAGTGDYPWQFETKILVRPRKKEQYQQAPPAEPGTEEQPGGEIARTLTDSTLTARGR